VAGDLVALQFIGHSQTALEIFIFVRMNLLLAFYPHWADTIAYEEKQQQINTPS